MIDPSQRLLPVTIQHTHKGQTSMSPGGNRTSNLSTQAEGLKATWYNYKQVRRKFLVCRQFLLHSSHVICI